MEVSVRIGKGRLRRFVRKLFNFKKNVVEEFGANSSKFTVEESRILSIIVLLYISFFCWGFFKKD
jgi:hypothetical protein